MDMLIEDGADTLEHCYRQSEEMLRRCMERNLLHMFTPLVTRSPDYFEAIELPLRLREGIAQAGEAHWSAVCRAVRAGARIALGTDFLSHLRIGGTWPSCTSSSSTRRRGWSPPACSRSQAEQAPRGSAGTTSD